MLVDSVAEAEIDNGLRKLWFSKMRFMFETDKFHFLEFKIGKTNMK